jgi:hypothetical protein
MNIFKQTLLILFLATQIMPLTADKPKTKLATPLNVAKVTAYRGGMVVGGLATAVSALIAARLFAAGIVEGMGVRGYDQEWNLFEDKFTQEQVFKIAPLGSVAFASLAYNCFSLTKHCYEKARQLSEEKK